MFFFGGLALYGRGRALGGIHHQIFLIYVHIHYHGHIHTHAGRDESSVATPGSGCHTNAKGRGIRARGFFAPGKELRRSPGPAAFE